MTSETQRAKHGWAWVMRDRSASPTGRLTKYKDAFDGAYRAACPACGEDTWWNAFDGEPQCDCKATS